VNKIKKPKESNLISKGTAKVFRYNAGVDAVVDGNTVQMAFLREYKSEEIQTAMEYMWFANEDGKLIKRGLYVSGHGEFGVPTLKEYDVYVALQRIFINKKTKRGICQLETENINDEDLEIQFTINELARELGYSTPSSATRENLKKSIRILLATTIFSKYTGGIYDIRNKKYIANAEIGFHFLESMQSLDLIGDDEIMDVTKIKLSKFTYDQILNDYKLFYNKNIYNKTKNLMARKIYHMALQWKGNNNFSFVNINTLVEKFPMINVEDKYKKRDIKKAIKILNDKGMVRIKYDEDNPDKVYFIFNNVSEEVCVDSISKYITYKDTKERFYEIGFNVIEVDEYLEQQIENVKYIQALLRYVDERINGGYLKNPKAYVKKCIKNPLRTLDMKYYS
jgi:hypothetical protein